jgi:NAD+ kinase
MGIMAKSERSFRNIVIASHPRIPDAIQTATQIASFINSKGLEVQYGFLKENKIQTLIKNQSTDLLIALGGDGTMLRAGHVCAPHDVPIFGINLGKFGFLTEIKHDQWEDALPQLLGNDFWFERRMMLRAEHYRGNEKLGGWIVLNEVVISRGQIVRPVHLDTSVDGRYLTTYVADGLIAATPTGSTAYALAVGGPILPPELRNILLVPVAPHLSIDRAIVLAEGSSVSITVHTEHQAVISIDGHHPIELVNGDSVNVRASKHTVRFVRIQDPGYFYRNLTPHMNRNPSIGASE